MAGANWFDVGSFGLGAIGNIAGGYLQGQGQKAGMESMAKANIKAAQMGQMGSMLALGDARAARSGQYAQNIFGQLAPSLFAQPIDFAWQEAGKRKDLNEYIPMQFAMQRQENRLGEEEEQTPLFRGGRQKEAYENRLAGRYAAALPAMTQWGSFNLPTA